MTAPFRVLALGDVVGGAGLAAIEARLASLAAELRCDFVVVNGENAAGNGNGLAARGARRLFAAGANAVTLGDHWFRKADLVPMLNRDYKLLRPANYPPQAAGKGWQRYQVRGVEVGLLVVQGRVFMEPVDCPFRAADTALAALAGCDLVLAEVHAEATSEKHALAFHLDGRVAALWGTHTHVQTADERILTGGTAYITDLGMSGPHDGIIGREAGPVLSKLRDGMPAPFRVASGDLRLSGIVVEIQGGRATAIARVNERVAAKGSAERDDPEPGDE